MNYWGESAEKESISGVFDALGITRNGIALREAGDLDAAEQIFAGLIRDFPGKTFGWQEMGVLLVQRGQPEEALEYFRHAVEAEPADLLTRSHYAMHLGDLGHLDGAHRAIDEHPPTSEDVRRKLLAMKDFLTYIYWRPKMEGLAYANHIEINRGFLNAAEVETRIFAAIEAGSAFSLLRLGDGEGAWINLGEKDEEDYQHLYEYNRREMLRIWFGDDRLFSDRNFQSLRAGLMDAIYSTDILGVPYSLRINREYNIKSVRGVPSCLNILRYYVDNMWDGPAQCCSHDIHVELQDSGFFPRLFQSGVPMGIIGCHSQLPYKLASQAGAKIRRAYLIPEEKGFAEVLTPNGTIGPHFPRYFNHLMDDLAGADQKGMVWLVAAGYLGKLYCGIIRQRGGIALDIGSLVDGWCGKITRPPLRNQERFALKGA